MTTLFHRGAAAALLALVIPAGASGQGLSASDVVLRVEFLEAQSDDSLRFVNVANCPGVEILEVSVDLSTALGPVIFDTASGGPGYEDEESEGVTAINGGGHLGEISRLSDGGRVLTVALEAFGQGESLAITVDFDDPEGGAVAGTADDVSAREFERTSVAARIRAADGTERAERAVFGPGGNAVVGWRGACGS